MPKKERATFMVEDAEIKFPNFRGKAGRFNAEGVRSFNVELDMETAERMKADGWNVKPPKGEPDEDGEPQYLPTINIGVRFDVLPPTIVLITSKGRTMLTEKNVGILDSIDIAKADLIARARVWDDNGTPKVKAYLKSLFVTVDEDPLMRKYGLAMSMEEAEDEEGPID